AVITTGGLGPTTDDVSKTAVAGMFGMRLEIDQEHVRWMQERWRKRFGREMPASNMAQATVPVGGRKLTNNHGSALGVFVEDERGWVAMLPGVPREARGMTDDTLIPLLKARASTSTVISSKTLRTTGVAESLLGDLLRDFQLGDGLSLAYLPSPDGVDLRLTVRGLPAEAAEQALVAAAAKLRAVVGESIYGEGDTDLAAVVLEACRANRETIAVAESCTGGLLGARLTAIPGSSDVVIGGVIAYANSVKTSLLGVLDDDLRAQGAVSEQVVRQMAVGACQRLGATFGLAITGIAGPGGGTPDKPVGTVWVALATPGGVETRRLSVIGDRDEIRRRSAQAALEMLRRWLSKRGAHAT
ncbi:MAG TPA: CinA family nicotinamide mononucleotide deamidase-related protein, partial [Gemmatimonadaceae bacterium]